MAKIRDDLEGVVWVEVDGQGVKLAAGDTVPRGVDVGAHLLDDAVDDDQGDDDTFPEGAPELSWKGPQLVAYAKAHGVDLDGATKKADVLAAIEAAQASTGDNGQGGSGGDPDAGNQD
ncbi:hypothetical protein SEA_ANGELIQUE_8 [Gordonia phage Angelique]|nr:hypothetical protein SEA_ANGELIQUE_8 [Gordonia phage Angelique]